MGPATCRVQATITTSREKLNLVAFAGFTAKCTTCGFVSRPGLSKTSVVQSAEKHLKQKRSHVVEVRLGGTLTERILNEEIMFIGRPRR